MNRVLRTGTGWSGEAMDSIWGEDWLLSDGSTLSGFLRDDVQIVSEDGLRLGVASMLEIRKSEVGPLDTLFRANPNDTIITRGEDQTRYRVADMADDSDGWVVCTLARGYG